jgi:replicative DNA helicase
MSTKDEDLALVSILSAHPADVLPYLHLPFFKDLFPTRSAASKWVLSFWDTNRQLPRLALLKKTFPAINTLQQAEPIAHAIGVLRQQYVGAVAFAAGEKMTDAMDKNDVQLFLKHARAMDELLTVADKPVQSAADDSSNFIEQLGLALDKDAALSLKVMTTGFKPVDDEDGGGLRPGHIYVLASLVNLGKTYVSLQLAENIRKAGYRVLYVSTEMTKEDLMLRAHAVRFGLNVNELIKREQPQSSISAGESREDWYKRLLQSVQAKIDADKSPGKLFISGCDEGVLTPRQLKADAKIHGVDVVFIDAAQDIRDSALTKERTPALYNAVSELNQMVKGMNLALFVTVQLDSEVEKKGLTQGNLNRIQWAQVFAQKAHVVFSMLGSRDSDFRDMSVDKTRDGKAGRKFWLTFKFPCVEITATTKTPGSLDDLEDAKPAETLAELEAALSSNGPPDPPASQPAPPASQSTPPKMREPPKKVTEQPVDAPSDDDDAETSSPYKRRREEKAAKKLPRRR